MRRVGIGAASWLGAFSLLALGNVGTLDAQMASAPAALRAPVASSNVPEDVARATHLLSRATWGVRQKDLDAVMAMGAKAWLDKQLDPSSIPDDAASMRVTLFPTAMMTMGEVFENYGDTPKTREDQQKLREIQQQLQKLQDSTGMNAQDARRKLAEINPALANEMREIQAAQQARSPQQLIQDLTGAKIQRSVFSERQLEDVMTDFWYNHFNVVFSKGNDRYMVGDYERNAIRPNVFGKFEDMLLATAQHPAMLFYLDNWQSVYVDPATASARAQTGRGQGQGQQLLRRIQAMTPEEKQQLVIQGRVTAEQLKQIEAGQMIALPNPQQGQQRERGLNENYARELMELHTLGVDGGYTQQDVIEVARAFTGWTFQPYNQGRAAQNMMDAMQPAAAQGARPGAAARPGQPGAARPGQPGAVRPGQPGAARPGQPGVMPPAGAAGRVARPNAAGRAAGARANAARGLNQPYIGEGDVPFVFRPNEHDPGKKVILGRLQLPPGGGMQDGLDVIHMLATHPSTAKFIATKLVERFVSDQPPADLVNHIADVFLKTNGDLKEVTRALFTADQFYKAEYRGTKVKTPYELVVSSLRATSAEVGPSQPLNQTLRNMGHAPYTYAAPTGFPAMSEDWVNTGAMLARMTFGLDLANNRVQGIRVDNSLVANATATEMMLKRLMPGTDVTALSGKIAEDLQTQALAPRAQAARALGLALGSPEFQRR
jgi:uncharacterized protein (DUF1800 family)